MLGEFEAAYAGFARRTEQVEDEGRVGPARYGGAGGHDSRVTLAPATAAAPAVALAPTVALAAAVTLVHTGHCASTLHFGNGVA
ncbi:hypothetical protein GCM10009654_38290 [Streptomyces hebeiensis]|uniref:Uncharacterized protein n=1 Tax=Streptomyces hebeiensis TaxID=229486 RepID=A0ABN1UX62_9ACTN